MKKIKETTFPDIYLFYFSIFIFKKITVSLKKQPFRKKVIVEEELDCIDIDGIGNLEARLVFINEKCWYLVVVNNDGEFIRNINQIEKSEVFR